VALYAERASELFADPAVCAWLLDRANAILRLLEEATKAGDDTRAVLAIVGGERGKWFPAKERGNRYTPIRIL